MDMQWCLSCNKQFDSKQFDNQLGAAFASYCSIECMSREQLPLSPAPHAINARLRARFEAPSPVGWSRQVKEPRSRSMSRARPRASTTASRPPVIQIGFEAEDRAPTPDSEVAWSLPAAGATRLVGSKWMGKDYEGIKCWAHGVRGYPEDDLSDDDFSDISEVQTTFPVTLKAPTLSRSASRRATTSSAFSITPKHMSVFTIDDTASLATPVTDNCLAQGYVESYVQSNTPPQAAHHLRRFMTGSSPQPVSTPKPKPQTAQSLPAPIPKSPVEPVLIARSQQMSLRPDARAGRDWGGLYDDCEKEQLASDRIGSYVPSNSWQHRGRTRQRAHTDVLHR